MTRKPQLRAPGSSRPINQKPSDSSVRGHEDSAAASTEQRDWLDEALRELPREQASHQFTSNVLRAARLRTSTDQPSRWLPSLGSSWIVSSALAVAAAVVLGFLLGPVLGFGTTTPPGPSIRDAAPQIARGDVSGGVTPLQVATSPRDVGAIRDELEMLRRELTELRQLRADVQPVAAIEGDEYDVVIDLREFLAAVERSSAPRTGSPASEGRSSRVVPTMW